VILPRRHIEALHELAREEFLELADLPAELKGPRVFALLHVDEEHAVAPEDLRRYCEEFSERLALVP
jgi:hypothetical protein